jgi:hypothetical protein
MKALQTLMLFMFFFFFFLFIFLVGHNFDERETDSGQQDRQVDVWTLKQSG